MRSRLRISCASISKVLLYALALTYLLREHLQCRKSISYVPLLGDLAPGYAVDVDAFVAFLFPSRRYAHDLAPLDAALRVLGDDLVTLGDLLLDAEACDREGLEVLRYRALVALTSRSLSGHQAAVDEVGGHQLVYDIKFSFGHGLLQEAADDGLVLFPRDAYLLSSPAQNLAT